MLNCDAYLYPVLPAPTFEPVLQQIYRLQGLFFFVSGKTHNIAIQVVLQHTHREWGYSFIANEPFERRRSDGEAAAE